MSVLLDAGFVFAFLHEDDERHPAAMSGMRRIARGELGTPIVTAFTLDELFTLIRARTRDERLEKAAHTLLLGDPPALDGLRVVPADAPLIHASWAQFVRHRRRGLSFTDASHLAAMESHGVATLATFDLGFEGLVETVS